MSVPSLFRKRLIPNECVSLKDDEILYYDETKSRLVTKWHALKPKKDLHHGYSAYFWDLGFKISKFYSESNDLLYWYCDIIDVEIKEDNTFVATDLLADVIIYPDGFVKVVDLDEISIALEAGELSIEMLKKALNSLNALLEMIYSGQFESYKGFLEEFEV